MLNEYDNLYGDISAVPYLVTQKKYSTGIKSVINKVLYGSDYPVTSAGSVMGMQSTIDMVRTSEYLNEDEIEKILSLNALKILE